MNSNILIDVKKIPQLLQQNYQFIDIRSKLDFNKEHLTKFINIPNDEFIKMYTSLDKTIPIILLCYTGAKSYELARSLNQQGYQCYSISGGFYAIITPTNNSYY